jgi:hypothetical protein
MPYSARVAGPEAPQGVKLAFDYLPSNIMIESPSKYVLLLIYPIGHHRANVVAHRKQDCHTPLGKLCPYVARVLVYLAPKNDG